MCNSCCFHLSCRSICVDVGHWWWEPVRSDRAVPCLNSGWFVKTAVTMFRKCMNINLCWIVDYYVKFVRLQIARDVEGPFDCCTHDSLCSAGFDSHWCPYLKPICEIHLPMRHSPSPPCIPYSWRVHILFHHHLYLVIIVNVRYLAMGLCHGMCALWLLLFNSW
jgi:hypothetical protein